MFQLVVIGLICIGIASIIRGIYNKGVNDGRNEVDNDDEV
jgi:hypothetical protein